MIPRPFKESDRAALTSLGVAIVDWWDRYASLHLVAGDPVAAHLQIVDRGSTPGRRPGRTEMRLTVAPEHRRRGIGSKLFERGLAFAMERQARSMRAAYIEASPEEPALFFLRERGFMELQRYWPSRLNVAACDLTPFVERARMLAERGVRFLTYADVPDSEESRKKLYALETEARDDIPLVETEPNEREPFEAWVENFASRRLDAIELAEVDGCWVGMSTGVDWGFTGVLQGFRGQGIATALKVRAIRAARARGVTALETENHANNAPMLAINRKLGYQFGVPEVECVKWLPQVERTASPIERSHP